MAKTLMQNFPQCLVVHFFKSLNLFFKIYSIQTSRSEIPFCQNAQGKSHV